MKRSITMILSIFFVLVLATGCTMQNNSTQSATETGYISNNTESNYITTAVSVQDDAFSERDLSGEYDDNVYTITLTGTGAESSGGDVGIDGQIVTIKSAGTYILSGTLQDGSIIADAGKDDKIQLVLDGVNINSDTYAAIYVKQADKVFITLVEGSENTLTNGGTFTETDENNVDAVIFAKDDITFNGTGKLIVTSPAGHAIVGKDEVTITGGSYVITASNHAIRANDSIAIADGSFTIKAGKDGIHAENSDDTTLGNIYIAGGTFTIDVDDDAIHANTQLQIDGGTFDITAAEGLEATYILINDGEISISASDDGINAAKKSTICTPTVEINGGYVKIVMAMGDTDGIDSNGDIIITGGTIDVEGRSTFDCDGKATYTGGTIIINGQQANYIPTQNMGGGTGGFGGRGHR